MPRLFMKQPKHVRLFWEDEQGDIVAHIEVEREFVSYLRRRGEITDAPGWYIEDSGYTSQPDDVLLECGVDLTEAYATYIATRKKKKEVRMIR